MAEINSVNTLVVVSVGVVKDTLSELKSAGRQGSERIVLWLGRRGEDMIQIETMWVPEQESGFDFFRIPEHAMQALFVDLRKRRLMVAAQIHTHPGGAFHSPADDRGAVIRHTGALSLVLPYFGIQTQVSSFVSHAAVFRLSDSNEWLNVDSSGVTSFYQISK